MIFDMVIYVTLLLFHYYLRAVYFSVYDLESFTLDKSKYFVEMKSQKDFFIANVNVYRYSNLIKN